jgi:hypothetical protein
METYKAKQTKQNMMLSIGEMEEFIICGISKIGNNVKTHNNRTKNLPLKLMAFLQKC